MCKTLLRNVSLILATVMLVLSVFTIQPTYAANNENQEETSIVAETSDETDEMSQSGEVPDETIVSGKSKKKKKLNNISSKLTLKFKPVSRKIYKNVSGTFQVTFTAEWDDESEIKALLNDGWTIRYDLCNASGDVLESNMDISNGYKRKIKSSDGKFKVVATASKDGEQDKVQNSNTIADFQFPAKPANVSASVKKTSNNVTITWKAADNATGYYIYRSTKTKKPSKPIKKVGKVSSYKDKNLKGKKKYYYWVQAIDKESDYTTASALSARDSVTVRQYLTCEVKPYTWTIKLKKKAVLYDKSSGSKSHGSIPKGKTVVVEKFVPSGLKYGKTPNRVYAKLLNSKNKVVKKGWIKWSCTKGTARAKVAYINKKALDWSKERKEEWVNSRNFKSSTKYLIWTSTYAQRVNIFKGSNHHWKLIKSYRCTTGMYLYPTRSGMNFKIYKHAPKRVRAFTNTPSRHYYYIYLSFFRGGDAFHSISWIYEAASKIVVKSVKSNLKPDTRGCVRMTVDSCKWIYDNIPNNTRVAVY